MNALIDRYISYFSPPLSSLRSFLSSSSSPPPLLCPLSSPLPSPFSPPLFSSLYGKISEINKSGFSLAISFLLPSLLQRRRREILFFLFLLFQVKRIFSFFSFISFLIFYLFLFLFSRMKKK